jgi:hypothetical protein
MVGMPPTGSGKSADGWISWLEVRASGAQPLLFGRSAERLAGELNAPSVVVDATELEDLEEAVAP